MYKYLLVCTHSSLSMNIKPYLFSDYDTEEVLSLDQIIFNSNIKFHLKYY